MAGVDDYTLDTDELDAVITDLERTETDLELLITDLDKQMATLHETWEGLAASAHGVAHDELAQGMRAMRQAMVELRTAARSAHANYTAAGETNLSMWEQMR